MSFFTISGCCLIALAGLATILFMSLAAHICFSGIKGFVMFAMNASPRKIADTVEALRADPTFVPLSLTGSVIPFAVLFAEDGFFYGHRGIRAAGIIRALKLNIRSGRIVAGGSTITQQLAKNLFFHSRRRLSRKVAEFFAVRDLEKRFSKDELLELYLNRIYYGLGVQGIGRACPVYFERIPSEITLGQALMLGAILPCPDKYNPSQHAEMGHLVHQRMIRRLYREGFLEIDDAKNLYDSGELDSPEREEHYAEKFSSFMAGVRSHKRAFPPIDPEIQRELVEMSKAVLPGHTAQGLIAHARICLSIDTVYMLGGLGELVSEGLIDNKAAQYPAHYTQERVAFLRGLVGNKIRGFDCSGLVKSYLFGGLHKLTIDPERDKSSAMMFDLAERKGPMEGMPESPGVCVFLPGHIGVYAGGGRVIESTLSSFGDGVVETELAARPWTHWLECPYIGPVPRFANSREGFRGRPGGECGTILMCASPLTGLTGPSGVS